MMIIMLEQWKALTEKVTVRKTKDEIERQIYFQEQYFDIEVIC